MAKENESTNDRPPAAEKPSASDFIRDQAASLTPVELVALGKAQGIDFTTSLVGKVRRGAGHKKPSPAKKPAPGAQKTALPAKRPAGPPAKAALSSSKKAETFQGTKADFIRQFSEQTYTVLQVVQEGKKAGVKLSANQVSAQRSSDRAKAAKNTKGTAKAPPRATSPAKPVPHAKHSTQPAKKPAAAPVKKTTAAAHPPRSSSPARAPAHHELDRDDDAFFELVVRVGLTRAEGLLGEVKSRLAELTGRR